MAPDETEVAAVMGDQHCADPACAERDQDVVQERRQLRAPPPVAVLDRADDVGRVDPIVEYRADDAARSLHRQQPLTHQPASAPVPSVDGQLVRYDRRQKRRRQEWKERLPETGTRLVRADRLEIDVGVEKIFQR